MLDEVIHKHLDIMDKIEDAVEEDILKIIADIDIGLIMDNPEAEMLFISSAIRKVLIEGHIPDAIQAGKQLAIEIREHKEIVVQDSNDPNLNKEEFENDKSPN